MKATLLLSLYTELGEYSYYSVIVNILMQIIKIICSGWCNLNKYTGTVISKGINKYIIINRILEKS